MQFSSIDGLFFKLGLAACLFAPSLACNGDKDTETDGATLSGTTTTNGTTTSPGTTTDDTSTTNGTTPTSTTNPDPTSTTNGTDPTTNGTDPTTGGGDAKFCQEACAGDADCFVNGLDQGLTCQNNRCTSDLSGCTADEECQALFSGWVTQCQDDGGCLQGQVCINIGDDAAGRCATPPSDVLMCETLMQSEVTVKKFMDGSDVQVCANTDSECHPDGYCFNPCEANTDCANVAGLPMCNVATGSCECASDDDCKNSGVDGYAVCNNGVCGCGSDADCAGNPNADTCYDGACGCSEVAVCQGDPSFDGTTKVCEGF